MCYMSVLTVKEYLVASPSNNGLSNSSERERERERVKVVYITDYYLYHFDQLLILYLLK